MKPALRFNLETGEFIGVLMIPEDENGEYKLPMDCTFEKWAPPIWKPVYKNGAWIEGATEEEMRPVVIPVSPTIEEQLEEEKLKVRRLETQLNQTNADLQGFMDFYFENMPL